MKITIKNKGMVVLNSVLSSFPLAIIVFIVAFVIFAVLIPIIQMNELNAVINLVFIMSLMISFVFILIKVTDAYLYSRTTFIEVDKKSVNCVFSGLKKGRVSFLNSQVQSMNIEQNFADRILKLSRINVNQISGRLKVYGFDFKEASDFVTSFNKKFKTEKQI